MFSTPSFSDSTQAQPLSTEVSFLQAQSPLEIEGRKASSTQSYEAEWVTEKVFFQGSNLIHKITTNYGKNFTDPPIKQESTYLTTVATPIFEYDTQDNLLNVSLAERIVKVDARDPEPLKAAIIPLEGYFLKDTAPIPVSNGSTGLNYLYEMLNSKTGDTDWLKVEQAGLKLTFREDGLLDRLDQKYRVSKIEDLQNTGLINPEFNRFSMKVPLYQEIGVGLVGEFTEKELFSSLPSPYIDPAQVHYENLVYSWRDSITSNVLKGSSLAGAKRVTEWDLMDPTERAIAKAKGLSPNPMAPQASPSIPPSIQEPPKPSNRVVIPIGQNEVKVTILDNLEKESSELTSTPSFPKQIIPIGTNEVKVIVPSFEVSFQTLEERSEPTTSFSPSSFEPIDLSSIAPSNISTTPIQLGDVEFWRRLEQPPMKDQGSSNPESLKMEIQLTEV